MSSLVDSKHQKLSNDEIVAIAAKETGGKYTGEQIKASLMAEVAEAGGLVMRQGNTLFIMHRIPNREDAAIFRAVNADTMPNYLKNSLAYAKAVGMMGLQYIVTIFDEPSLLNIFKYVKRNQPFKNMGYQADRLKDGRYRVTVNLGDVKQQGGLPDKAVPQTPGAL